MNWHQLMDEGLKLLKTKGAAAAEPLLLQAMPLAGDKPELQAMTHFNLALIYYDLKRVQESEKSLATAIEIISNHLPKQNELYGMFLKTMIEFYEKENRLADTKKYYLLEIDLTKNMFGKRHPYVGNLLAEYAEVLFKTGDFAEAEKNLTQVLDIMSTAKGPDHPHNAPFHSHLAKCYDKLGSPTDAEYHRGRANALGRGSKRVETEEDVEIDL